MLITNPADDKILSLGLKAFSGPTTKNIFADQGYVGWAFIENIF